MMNLFGLFRNRKVYEGPVVDLKERYRVSEKTAYDGVPTVYYDILRHSDKEKVGTTDLRLSIEGDMYYYGNIGYNILPSHRGNHYAYYACRLLFLIAKKEFDMNELIITCSPDNDASRKTIEKLGGVLIETTDVPPRHWLYQRGETVKNIYYILQ